MEQQFTKNAPHITRYIVPKAESLTEEEIACLKKSSQGARVMSPGGLQIENQTLE